MARSRITLSFSTSHRATRSGTRQSPFSVPQDIIALAVLLKLVPVFAFGPPAVALGSELRVLFQTVVTAVKQVLAVKLDERQQ